MTSEGRVARGPGSLSFPQYSGTRGVPPSGDELLKNLQCPRAATPTFHQVLSGTPK